MEDKIKIVRSPKEVEYNGKTYRSLKQFADENDLRYPTVTVQYKNGMSLDEIISRQRVKQNTRTCKNPGFFIDDKGEMIEFNTRADAAKIIGVSASLVYQSTERAMKDYKEEMAKGSEVYKYEKLLECWKDKHPNYEKDGINPPELELYCSAQYVYNHRKNDLMKDKIKPRKDTRITIEGVEYANKTAACLAYDVVPVTVQSRIQRDQKDGKINKTDDDKAIFEQVLLDIVRSRKRLPPVKSVFDSHVFIEDGPGFLDVKEEEVEPIYQPLILKLKNIGYHPAYRRHPDGRFIIQVDEDLGGKLDENVTIGFGPEAIEIMVPDLLHRRFFKTEKQISEFMNSVNDNYCGIKIINENTNLSDYLTVCAQIIKGNKLDYTQIIRTLLAAMGSAEELRQQLER